MNFSLDWDGTSTSDMELFLQFCIIARARGHKVYIVTMRYPSECNDIPEEFRRNVDGIYPTSRQAKQPYMAAQGIVIHVWIDDAPLAVLKNADEVWGVSSPEGQVITENHNG